MSRLSLLDLAFFLTESEESPKHVAGLMIFKKPSGSSAKWVHGLAEELAQHDQPVPPFNKVIDFRALGGPRWRDAESFAIEEHLFYHNPESVLGEKDLFNYVAGLHEPLMDRSKPMWEFHLIDRVAGGRFAVYSKMHHAYADGVTMSRWGVGSLNTSAKSRALKAIWTLGDKPRREGAEAEASRRAIFGKLLRGISDWRKILGGTTKLTTQLALVPVGLSTNAVALPF